MKSLLPQSGMSVCQLPATPVKPRQHSRIKIITHLRKCLVFEATKDVVNHRKSYHDIASSIDLKISENTLRQAFAKEGYHRRAARKKPLLSQSQKAKHLAFAQFMMLWDEFDWRSVLWTDECYIWMGEIRGVVNIT